MPVRRGRAPRTTVQTGSDPVIVVHLAVSGWRQGQIGRQTGLRPVTPERPGNKLLINQEKLERAKGLEPSTPTFATCPNSLRRAPERLLAASKGVDPAEATASDRGTITIGEICDWYLREAG